MKFTFKSDDKSVAPYWDQGFSDGMNYYKDSLIHKRILKFSDKPGYTNGWAEANISAYSKLHDKLRTIVDDNKN